MPQAPPRGRRAAPERPREALRGQGPCQAPAKRPQDGPRERQRGAERRDHDRPRPKAEERPSLAARKLAAHSPGPRPRADPSEADQPNAAARERTAAKSIPRAEQATRSHQGRDTRRETLRGGHERTTTRQTEKKGRPGELRHRLPSLGRPSLRGAQSDTGQDLAAPRFSGCWQGPVSLNAFLFKGDRCRLPRP